MTGELWTRDGRTVELRHVGQANDPDWFAEDPGQRPPHVYLLVDGDRTIDRIVVTPYDPWSPYDAVSDVLVRDGWTPPPPTEAEMAECEHGMSARLCSGPNHY